jgi:hypothetical protein
MKYKLGERKAGLVVKKLRGDLKKTCGEGMQEFKKLGRWKI